MACMSVAWRRLVRGSARGVASVDKLIRQSSELLMDVIVLATAFLVAVALRYEGDIPTDMLRRTVTVLPYVVTFQYVGLLVFAVPRFSWRYVGLREVTRIAMALGVTSSALLAARFASRPFLLEFPRLRYVWFPVGVILIDLVLVLVGLAGVRALRRLHGERQDALSHRRPDSRVATMLVGAGEAGVAVAKEIARRPDLAMVPVGFLDDDRRKVGSMVHGVPVLGSIDEMITLCRKTGAREVLITIARASGPLIRRIKELCERAELPVKIIPGLAELVGSGVPLSRIRSVAIEDLLRRDPVQLDPSSIVKTVGQRCVLVTGAGGSIGAELCRQICGFSPSIILLVELSENNLFHVHGELEREYPEVQVIPCLVDVCDHERMRRVFVRYSPDLVFHAAAYKHVPMMEWSPEQAVRNNVVGTKIVVELAAQPSHGVEAFVLISTDKAVQPSSVMGATKRVAEQIVQAYAHNEGEHSGTRFVAVRFGNVLGSAGSVVPMFREQIARGGPVTVTHPEMTRYFMTIPEACQLVLQASTMGEGGEIFILDMGEPVKIVDLARDLIRLSGLREPEDIAIEYVGIRDGEKLAEELSSADALETTAHPKIMVERTQNESWRSTDRLVKVLIERCNSGKPSVEVRAALRDLVVDFVPQPVAAILDLHEDTTSSASSNGEDVDDRPSL